MNQFEAQNGHASVAGERRLWRAMLRRAFEDVEGLHVHGNTNERQTIQISAGRWFMSNDEMPGSFLWVCSHLSLDPGAIRCRVHELSRKGFLNL
jgi:hypothetical protein